MEPPHDSESPYSEPDDCDCGKSAQYSTSGENSELGGQFDDSRQQEENQLVSQDQDQLNSQFARADISSNQEPTHDSQSPYSEPKDCDYGKSAQHSTSGENSELGGQFDHSRQQEEDQLVSQEAQDQLNSQFARANVSFDQEPTQDSQSPYSEPDDCNCGKSPQYSTSGDNSEFGGQFDHSRQQEENQLVYQEPQDQLNSQFARGDVSSKQEPLHDSQSPYSDPNGCVYDKSTEYSTSGENSELGGQFHHSRQQQEENQPIFQDELNSQFARAHDSSNQEEGPAEEERVFQTVKRILNKRTPNKFDMLKDLLMDSGITSANILAVVTLVIYKKAVVEPAYCPKYALLLSDLSEMLPTFPSDETGGKEISCRRVLLNLCQETFESSDKLREEVEQMTAPEQKMERRVRESRVKLRTLGNIRLIGELLKKNMLTERVAHCVIKDLLDRCDSKPCSTEENVEAICQFLNIVGEKLDGRKSRPTNDIYYSRLNDLISTNPQLAPRLSSKVRDILDLRANNWAPKREEVKGKTINEIHSEAEKNYGLRPGATTSTRMSRTTRKNHGHGTSREEPMTRPGSGPGSIFGMAETRKKPGNRMPGFDNDNWEWKPRSQLMPRGDQQRTMQLAGRGQSPVIGKSTISLNTKLLPQGSSGSISGKTSALLQDTGTPPAQVSPDERLNILVVSLLEEYFSVRLLDEALQCVEELKSPAYHPEVIKEAISLGLDKSPPCVEPVTKLLEYLFERKIFTAEDIGSGCLLYGSMLDDEAIDLPKAPNNFGEIIGKLVLAGVLDFKVVNDVLKKVVDARFQKALFDAAMHVVSSTPSGQEYAPVSL